MDEPSNLPDRLPTERAEELVDQMGRAITGWTGRAGFWVLKKAALAREEAEDIWAEAQDLSRRESP